MDLSDQLRPASPPLVTVAKAHIYAAQFPQKFMQNSRARIPENIAVYFVPMRPTCPAKTSREALNI